MANVGNRMKVSVQFFPSGPADVCMTPTTVTLDVGSGVMRVDGPLYGGDLHAIILVVQALKDDKVKARFGGSGRAVPEEGE